jgi:large subunit ribosomal protein L41
LKPYVSVAVKLTKGEKKDIFGKLPQGGLTGSHYYDQQLWKREIPSRAPVKEDSEVTSSSTLEAET